MNIYIKNMVSQRCKLAVASSMQSVGLSCGKIELGVVETTGAITSLQMDQFSMKLLTLGLEVLNDKKQILVEKIKNVVTEMIHYDNDLPTQKYSVYISKQTGYNYTYLANTFSEVEGVSITQYIIRHKVERIKELLGDGELNLTEIAYKLNYSSVGHLCNQFKKTTGLTPALYNRRSVETRTNLEDL